MAYRNKYGITKIKKDRFNNLSISWEDDTGNGKKRYPVLLYIPDLQQSQHEHIVFTKKEIKALGKWINDFLKNN